MLNNMLKFCTPISSLILKLLKKFPRGRYLPTTNQWGTEAQNSMEQMLLKTVQNCSLPLVKNSPDAFSCRLVKQKNFRFHSNSSTIFNDHCFIERSCNNYFFNVSEIHSSKYMSFYFIFKRSIKGELEFAAVLTSIFN